MTDFLERVVAERRADADEGRRRRPLAEIPRPAASPDAFADALDRARTDRGLAVIAEVKRRSPALGDLAAGPFDVATQARAYVAGGAAAISVLVEPRHWGGSLDDLRRVRAAAPQVPLLAKDVIVDEHQIAEAREAGADAVLLIAEALDDVALPRLVAFAASLGVGTLVEAHETVAFTRAIATGARVVGINARDLRLPSKIDRDRAQDVHALVREGQLLVAESGIARPDDVARLPRRVDAILVGTALMRAGDPAPLLDALMAARRGVTA